MKFPRIVENDNGWSDWIAPTMRIYKMACCDCGLVHNLQFKVVVQGKSLPGGFWKHGKK
jgi:hypothetical protein